MISNRFITKISAILTSIALIFCAVCIVFSDKLSLNVKGYSFEYEKKLFDVQSIIEIDILMDDDTFREMLDGAISEVYYKCDVVVNGETFYSVGIRPKGNTSLSSIASDPDCDRYSFKIEFDQFVDGQTCFGLDKLVLNNNYADATNMKEAIVYDMFAYLGADAPMYNYAKISVNGEYFGIYLALEAVEDSFLLRNYGASDVKLYKPDSMDFGGGNIGGMGMGGGSNLNYTGDSVENYSAIWDGAVSNIEKNDKLRVVTALKGSSDGESIDIENIAKYMAVHSFSVNDDSLSGSMAHNYYLAETNGVLNIIPWDYNLSFGGMGMGGTNSATDVINDPIDEKWQSTSFFDAFFENDKYSSIYHSAYSELIEGYFNSGIFEETYDRIRSQIDALVKDDPNAFYSYEEYLTAADAFYTLVKRRAVSVMGQLSGDIPSTKTGQNTNSENLIDGSDIDLSSLGRMSGGRGNGMDFGNGESSFFEKPSRDNSKSDSGTTGGAAQGGADDRNDDNSYQSPQFGEIPSYGEDTVPPNMPDGENVPSFDGSTMPNGENVPSFDGSTMPNGENMQSFDKSNIGNMQSFPGIGNGMNFNGSPSASNDQEPVSFIGILNEYLTPIISMLMLAVAFIFVKLYKRKRY